MKFPAKDLPLYTEFPDPRYRYELVPNRRGFLQCFVRPYRKAIQNSFNNMITGADKMEKYYSESSEKVTGAVNSLKTDPNLILKTGVIGVSGLGGVVLGYKGGVIRKFTYMLVGSGTAAALIFPQAAKCVFNYSWTNVEKQYYSIRGKNKNESEC